MRIITGVRIWSARMPDTETRLLEAERALHRLEMQIEQYQLHFAELIGQPYEADKARGVLNRMTIELEWQRRYCELLGNAVAADGHLAKNGSRVI